VELSGYPPLPIRTTPPGAVKQPVIWARPLFQLLGSFLAAVAAPYAIAAMITPGLLALDLYYVSLAASVVAIAYEVITASPVLIAGGAFLASWKFGITPVPIIAAGTLLGILWKDPGKR
jgi:hypothetical protein